MMRIVPASDEVRWLLVEAVPVKAHGGAVEEVVATATDVTELKQSELASRANEQRYERVIGGLHEGVCALDLDSRITYVNRRLCHMLGYRREELLGRSGFELMQSVDWLDGDGERLLLSRRVRKRDVPLRHKDGSTVWAFIAGSCMTGLDGQPTGMLAVFLDVTERKLADDAVRQSEARFRRLIENSEEGIVIVDASGVMTYASPSMERLLGRPPAELVGETMFDVFHPDDVLMMQGIMEQIVKMPGIVQLACPRVRHQDGSWRYMEGSGVNYLHDPAICGIVANFRDVTARKLAEQRARFAAEQIERLTGDAIIMVDKDNRVQAWNHGAEKLFGWTQDEVMGKPPGILPKEIKARARADFQRIRKTGETMIAESHRVNREGERIPVLGSWTPVPLEDGSMGVLAILKDIRSHKEAHRQLQEQARQLTLLTERERIAMDLHDGVIQSIYGVTLTLGALRRQIGAVTAPSQRSDAESSLEQAIDQLTETIRSVRDYIFNLRSGTPGPADLTASLHELATEFAASTALQPEVRLRGNVAKLASLTVANVVHIAKEALSNVARHAAATKVEVQLAPRRGSFELVIRDNGRGFDPTLEKRRLGDGLRNMHERARSIGASLSLDSHPGSGTEVRVLFK